MCVEPKGEGEYRLHTYSASAGHFSLLHGGPKQYRHSSSGGIGGAIYHFNTLL